MRGGDRDREHACLCECAVYVAVSGYVVNPLRGSPSQIPPSSLGRP